MKGKIREVKISKILGNRIRRMHSKEFADRNSILLPIGNVGTYNILLFVTDQIKNTFHEVNKVK